MVLNVLLRPHNPENVNLSKLRTHKLKTKTATYINDCRSLNEPRSELKDAGNGLNNHEVQRGPVR